MAQAPSVRAQGSGACGCFLVPSVNGYSKRTELLGEAQQKAATDQEAKVLPQGQRHRRGEDHTASATCLFSPNGPGQEGGVHGSPGY